MSITAKIMVRSGIYLALAGVCAAAVMDLDETDLSRVSEPVALQTLSVVRTDIPGKVMIPSNGDGVTAFVIDMAEFSPDGEHWAKMNSDDPAVRQEAMDALYAAYGNDFMMLPTVAAAATAQDGQDAIPVPLPPVKPTPPSQ